MISYKLVVLAAAIGIIPVGGWLWLMAIYSNKYRHGNNFFMKIFFVGVLTAIPASVIEIILMESGGSGQVVSAMQSVWSFSKNGAIFPAIVSSGLVAMIEEASKGLGIAYSIYSDKFTRKKDGLIFGIVIGLAFAVTENGIYFANIMKDQPIYSVYSIIVLRFLLSTSAHVIYSGILGKFFADAAMVAKFSSKSFLFSAGAFLSVLVHSSFNFLLSTKFSFMILFIIVFGMYVLWVFYAEEDEKRKSFTAI